MKQYKKHDIVYNIIDLEILLYLLFDNSGVDSAVVSGPLFGAIIVRGMDEIDQAMHLITRDSPTALRKESVYDVHY